MYLWSPELHLAASLAVCAPLIYAGTSKLLDPKRFAAVLPKFGIYRVSSDIAIARVVGVVELGVAASAVTSATLVSASVLVVAYVILTFAMAIARRNGASGDCGCFGALGGRIDAAAVARNGLLALAAGYVAYLRGGDMATEYAIAPALVATALGIVAAAATDTMLLLAIRR